MGTPVVTYNMIVGCTWNVPSYTVGTDFIESYIPLKIDIPPMAYVTFYIWYFYNPSYFLTKGNSTSVTSTAFPFIGPHNIIQYYMQVHIKKKWLLKWLKCRYCVECKVKELYFMRGIQISNGIIPIILHICAKKSHIFSSEYW